MARVRSALVTASRRAAVALAAAVLTACSGDDGRSAPTTAAITSGGPSTTGGATGTTTAEQGAAVVVDDPGAAPRVALRYALVTGATVTTEDRTTVTSSAGGHSSGAITTVRVIDAEVLEVVDGVATMRITYRDVSVEAAPDADATVVASSEQGADALRGATVTLTVDPVGSLEVRSVDLASGEPTAGEQPLADFAATLAQLVVLLPEDEVGAGATWTTSFDDDLAGIRAAVTQTFRVVSLDGDGADLEITTRIDLSGGGTAASEGSGTVRLWFDSFLPETERTARNTVQTASGELVQDVAVRIVRR